MGPGLSAAASLWALPPERRAILSSRGTGRGNDRHPVHRGGDGTDPGPGPTRSTVFFTYHDPEGRLIAGRAGDFLGAESLRESIENGGVRSGPIVWSSRAVSWVSGSGLAVGIQDRFEVMRFGTEGVPELIVRVATEPVRVDAAMREHSLNQRLGTISDPDLRRRRREALAAFPYTEVLPARAGILLDEEGRIWVEEFVDPMEDGPAVWWVLGADGELLARTALPAGFTPYRVESDRLLGVWRDELGVEHVDVRGITRDADAPRTGRPGT